MPAQRKDIETWFDYGVAQGASHMIVKCDTFDFRGNPHDECDYPVYVNVGDDPREIEQSNGDRTMEVYVLDPDRRDAQVGVPGRVFNYDPYTPPSEEN